MAHATADLYTFIAKKSTLILFMYIANSSDEYLHGFIWASCLSVFLGYATFAPKVFLFTVHL